ncbi:patatin-like phospholipase family protein [Hymenobacter sp. IS2118]|uniref:patatin-like phospholipase family protein n=1 Tax=Hymenobacter sp. IS2118 TaxID=1505605 RepID=UPI0005571452|nr:patatin-like phospholipase family protein [Hymenobacter sp. IS2118]
MSVSAYYAAAQEHLTAARAAVARHTAASGGWQVSDIVDGEGHQYVDLVMEGGGVLGIALVGYVYVLEQLGVRFLQLGGTSAGSINALLMAAAGPVQETKTDWLLERLSAQNLQDFVDGDDDARDFVQVLVDNGRLLRYLWKGAQVLDNIQQDFGLNSGDVFHAWLRRLLDERGIRTVRDLNRLRTLTAADGLRRRDGSIYAPVHPIRVALVAADVTTESKAVFPEMAGLYYHAPEEVHPADFVRASMAIPGFFHPHQVRDLPRAGAAGGALWEASTGYCGPVPEAVYFIDGGILSNFPIDLFHQHYKVPACPTFGVKLGLPRNTPNRAEKFTQLLGHIFATARHGHDYDFIARNPDFRHLVSYADTSRFNWLDFSLDDAAKQALFAEGARAAAAFVDTFDWAGYQEVRRQLIKAFQVTDAVQPSTAIT